MNRLVSRFVLSILPVSVVAQGTFSVTNLHPLDLPSEGISVRPVADSLLVFSQKVAMDQHALNCFTEMYGPDGDLLWEKYHYAVRNTNFGARDAVSKPFPDGTYLTGTRTYGIAGGDSLYLSRYSALGDRQGSDPLFTSYRIWPSDIVVMNEAVYLSGSVQDSSGGTVEAYVVKADTSGGLIWLRRYANIWAQYVGITCHDPDRLYLVGEWSDGFLPFRSRLLALDTAGAVVWAKMMLHGLPGYNGYSAIATSVTCDSDGDPVVAGTCTPDYPYTEGSQFMAKYSKVNGATQWIAPFDTSLNEFSELLDLELAQNDDLLACGSLIAPGGWQAAAYRVSADGTVLSERKYRFLTNGTAENRLMDIEELPGGGWAMTGTTRLGGGFYTVMWVLRTDTLGCLIPGCEGVGMEEIVLSAEPLLSVWPNPATGPIQISLNTAGQKLINGNLVARVLSSDGRLVRTTPMSASGYGTVDTSDLNSGSYLVQVATSRRLISTARFTVP